MYMYSSQFEACLSPLSRGAGGKGCRGSGDPGTAHSPLTHSSIIILFEGEKLEFFSESFFRSRCMLYAYRYMHIRIASRGPVRSRPLILVVPFFLALHLCVPRTFRLYTSPIKQIRKLRSMPSLTHRGACKRPANSLRIFSLSTRCELNFFTHAPVQPKKNKAADKVPTCVRMLSSED